MLCISTNVAWQNAKKNTGKDDAHSESNLALNGAMLANMDDGLELFKQYSDNPSFRAWLQDIVFNANQGREEKYPKRTVGNRSSKM